MYDLVVFPGHWLSANNFFWKVVRRGAELERVAQWRTLGRPEASLIGVQYRGNDEGQRLAPMRPVPGAAPWLFGGTPMAQGAGWSRFRIEIDHTAPSSPPGTTVVASVPDLYGPGFTAEMTYYETPAGANQTVGQRVLANLFDHLEVP